MGIQGPQCDAKSSRGKGLVHSLWRAMADLVQYLGLHAPVSDIINKLELVYGTIATFDVLIQNFYKLHQRRMEKVPVSVT